MTRQQKQFSKAAQRVVWSTVWVFFLSTPVICYRIRGIWGILIGISVAVIPFVSTLGYTLWYFCFNDRPKSFGKVATSSMAFALVSGAFICFAFPNQPTALKAVILWAGNGVLLGIIFAGGRRRKAGFFLWGWAFLQSGRGFHKFGLPGAAIGPALIGGFFVGFSLLGFLKPFFVKRLGQPLRRLWKDLVAYGWEFATFIVGYLLIIYVFGGLFAVACQINKMSLGKDFAGNPSFGDFLFFSLLTVSTLGYTGQSQPVTPTAKIMVSLEVLTGIFWITVIFANISSYAQELRKARLRRHEAAKR